MGRSNFEIWIKKGQKLFPVILKIKTKKIIFYDDKLFPQSQMFELGFGLGQLLIHWNLAKNSLAFEILWIINLLNLKIIGKKTAFLM